MNQFEKIKTIFKNLIQKKLNHNIYNTVTIYTVSNYLCPLE